jgi:hypothetical protein
VEVLGPVVDAEPVEPAEPDEAAADDAPAEAADDAAADEQSCAGYVAAYRDGQRRVLRAALAQVAQMGAGDEANDADDE